MLMVLASALAMWREERRVPSLKEFSEFQKSLISRPRTTSAWATWPRARLLWLSGWRDGMLRRPLVSMMAHCSTSASATRLLGAGRRACIAVRDDDRIFGVHQEPCGLRHRAGIALGVGDLRKLGDAQLGVF